MEIKKRIYKDSAGREWVVVRESLPKKKGEYKFWMGECYEINRAFRDTLKRNLLSRIKQFGKK